MRSVYVDAANYATVSLMEGDGNVWLVTAVEVNRRYRGRGAASRLMDRVIAEADREGIALILAVDPDGTGLDYDTLVGFYQRKGFGQLDDERTMVREPHARR